MKIPSSRHFHRTYKIKLCLCEPTEYFSATQYAVYFPNSTKFAYSEAALQGLQCDLCRTLQWASREIADFRNLAKDAGQQMTFQVLPGHFRILQDEGADVSVRRDQQIRNAMIVLPKVISKPSLRHLFYHSGNVFGSFRSTIAPFCNTWILIYRIDFQIRLEALYLPNFTFSCFCICIFFWSQKSVLVDLGKTYF